jgi:hypothetical protein
MVHDDARTVVYRLMHNFLLLAWRLRAKICGGEPELRYTSVQAPAPSEPLSPSSPDVSDGDGSPADSPNSAPAATPSAAKSVSIGFRAYVAGQAAEKRRRAFCFTAPIFPRSVASRDAHRRRPVTT